MDARPRIPEIRMDLESCLNKTIVRQCKTLYETVRLTREEQLVGN